MILCIIYCVGLLDLLYSIYNLLILCTGFRFWNSLVRKGKVDDAGIYY